MLSWRMEHVWGWSTLFSMQSLQWSPHDVAQQIEGFMNSLKVELLGLILIPLKCEHFSPNNKIASVNYIQIVLLFKLLLID